MYCEKFMTKIYTTSGWASDEELAASSGCLSGSWIERPKEGGVILYNHAGRVLVDGGRDCRHVLIVGATGTGKSRLVILPSLLYSLRAHTPRSLVVADVKGELQKATRMTALQNGYRILTINLRNPTEGDGWNPFERANQLYFTGNEDNQQKAWQLLENSIDVLFADGGSTHTDPFWRNSCASTFRGICAFLWEKRRPVTLEEVLRLIKTVPNDRDEDLTSELFREVGRLPAAAKARHYLTGLRTCSPTTRGNVLASFHSYMAPIASRADVMRMISGSSVDFQQIGLTPTVLYINLPDDTTALGALQGMLLTELMQALNDCALQHGGCLPVHTEMYLDEVCNIRPAIPGLGSSITVGRSRGIRYILAIQSYAQLCSVYGGMAETISSNCATWIALNVAKDETFRTKLSHLCGENAVGDPLITPSQLALLHYEEALVIRERCSPYFTNLEDYGKVVDRLDFAA